jgi:hypothetical protein
MSSSTPYVVERTLDDQAVDVVLAEYVQAREDDRASGTQLIALLTAIPALYGVAFIVLFGRDSQPDLPNALWAFLPMVPLGLTGWVIWIFVQMTVRGYYLRALERSLVTSLGSVIDLTTGELKRTANPRFIAGKQIRVPGLADILLSFQSVHSRHRSTRFLMTMGIAFYLVALFASTGVMLKQIDEVAVLVPACIFYGGSCIYVVVAFYNLGFKGHQLWLAGLSEADKHANRELEGELEPRHRVLVSYLLLPRPEEFVLKGLIVALAATLFGYFASSGNLTFGIGDMAVAFVAYELLAYQARYMINDARDAPIDETFAEKSDRRIPLRAGDEEGSIRRLRIVRITAGFRFAAAILVPIMLPMSLGIAVWIMLACMIPLTAAYEWIGDRLVALARPVRLLDIRVLAFFVSLALGYGLRAVIGIFLSTGDRLSITLALLVFAMMALHGFATVAMTWILEATRYLKSYGLQRRRCIDQATILATLSEHSARVARLRKRLSKRDVQQSLDNPALEYAQQLTTKPHEQALARHAGLIARDASVSSADDFPEYNLASAAVLAPRTKISYVWNAAYLLGVCFGAAAGAVAAAGLPHRDRVVLGVLVVSLGCVPIRARSAIIAWVSVGAAWALFGLMASIDTWQAACSAFPIAVLSTHYVFFRWATFEELSTRLQVRIGLGVFAARKFARQYLAELVR